VGILLTISDLLIPVTVLCIVVFGCLQRMDIYEVFLEGAKEGLQTVLDILPTLIGLMMAVVLYDEPVFSFCRDSENEIYAALRPSGKPCRHLCGCGTGAACFLRLDRV